MSESLPPPTYSQQDPDDVSSDTTESSDVSQPQLLIVPTVDAVNFQKGFLGAEDERAAIEGELQIKGADSGAWDKVTVTLRTVETAFTKEIELGTSDVLLWSRASSPSATVLPSSMLFAIPLMPDAPQSILTPHSSLAHILTATLHPVDLELPVLSKSLNVHTKRFTSHLHSVPIAPVTHSLDRPATVKVEVPRVTYQVGDPIPIYITIPPPPRELVVDEGLRLRNVKAELVQIVKVKRDDDVDESDSHMEALPEPAAEGTSTSMLAPEKPIQSSKAPISPLSSGPTFRSTLARSGASCRFHSSRPVRLRFIMHQTSPFSSPSNAISNLPNPEYDQLDGDTEYSSITQFTLLHSVTFQINVHVSFVNVGSRTERISTITIPITLLPPSALLPEVGTSTDEAYQKKHDRPPVQTNRYEDDLAPHYSEGEAGPSGLPHGAPPPFEERDAPPPFFSSAAEASTSGHLPTFLESEREIIIPPDSEQTLTHLPQSMHLVDGEGSLFGFTVAELFDGHSEDMQRSSTPPPTLEMASRDTDVTQLADMAEPERAIEALGLVLTAQAQHDDDSTEPPPPPPALDDPSDPPPSIDSDFRSPDQPRQRSPPVETPRLHTPSPVPPPENQAGNAPPPYLVPENHAEHITRPPPYVER
ncbi:hypothetical protein BT96DRAFT_870768 [Gymnopus androsaceus JB14]|uniref:Uncharacterized protein n=1 Tax=Gymnopus androsaceus JB14 TaxID=1447944 RepID=A0A6A4ISW8_9AGAR|nr:hypothetical protein BT96DRAFT_870768 [Gymnopus androsaceus JB14]